MLWGVVFIIIAVVACQRADTMSDVSSLDNKIAGKPVAGLYTNNAYLTDNGYTLNITIDQSKTQAVSHLLLQAQGCDGIFLNNNNVVASSVPVTFTTGQGTGCAFQNTNPFIKFDNLDIYKGQASFTLSITFNEKVQLADILIKSATNCFPFALNFTPQCETDVETHTETAYAYGDAKATCFSNYGFDRWGWTNGTYDEGTYTMDIYAAAGQCDITKGTKVGTLTMVYSAGTAVVTYNIAASYTLEESHVYVGTNPIYADKKGNLTVAPGSAPFKGSSSTYTITGLTGPVYLIAHATVDGFTD